MYDSIDAPLPWFTKVLLGEAKIVRDWWNLLLAVPA
jgi:general secretion pathway protein F